MKYFLKSFLAGVLIAISVTVYLSSSSEIIGALLFSLGLITILNFKFNLYTGKVGYILEKEKSYLLKVLTVIIGNYLGALLTSFLIMQTRIFTYFESNVQFLAAVKVSDSFISVLILSILCGLLLFIAVDNYKSAKEVISKYLIVIMCIMTFVLCSFEHSIANVVYLNFSKLIFTIDGVIFFLITLLGNAVGTLIIPLIRKIK